MIPRGDPSRLFSLDRDKVGPPPAPGPPVLIEPEQHIVSVVRRVTFAFDGRASGTQERVVLAQGVDVSAWRRGVLVVTGHEKNPWRTSGGAATTGALSVAVEAAEYLPEDPAATLVETSRTVAISPTIVDSSVMPALYQVAFGDPFGAFVRVSLWFNQGASAAGSAQTVTLSVHLVGRRG